jgi:hypothetical protein
VAAPLHLPSHRLNGLIHYSDHGVQYLVIRNSERLAECGAVTSVGSQLQEPLQNLGRLNRCAHHICL